LRVTRVTAAPEKRKEAVLPVVALDRKLPPLAPEFETTDHPSRPTADSSNRVGAVEVNVAVTALSEFIVTLHVGPEQAPDQPAKVDPAAGVAVRVTDVPG
jgi:hypothetical protein